MRVYIINGVVKINHIDIDHTALTSYDMQILPELFSTGSHTRLIISTDTIMIVLMNIILISPQKAITVPALYSFNNILIVLFFIKICSTLFHVKLILSPLHFLVPQLSQIKLSYLLLGIKVVSVYWMMNMLQSLIFLHN